jgi:hypothetical protein
VRETVSKHRFEGDVRVGYSNFTERWTAAPPASALIDRRSSSARASMAALLASTISSSGGSGPRPLYKCTEFAVVHGQLRTDWVRL